MSAAADTRPGIKVDIWSDIACPWCYVGKRRFEHGVSRYREAGGQLDVEVEYHSFELSPDTPVDYDGGEVDFLAQHKGLGVEAAEQMLGQMREIASGEGLLYDYAALKHTNTLKAHQVLHLAKAHGLQVELKQRLLTAYFAEGRHLGRDEELADLAAEVGLDRQLVLDALTDGTYAQAVQADVAQARAYGISGVPFFVLDNRYGISGAQGADVFAQALAQVAAEQVASS